MGGNSTKATSGINGAGTQAQQELGIPDSAKIFFEDTKRSVSILLLHNSLLSASQRGISYFSILFSTVSEQSERVFRESLSQVARLPLPLSYLQNAFLELSTRVFYHFR